MKHTKSGHPDHETLQKALILTHDILLQLNCKEREALEIKQCETVLRELEIIIEGISDLVANDRQFLLFDLVSVIPQGQVARKERAYFLFNDQLVIATVKRRSGTMRKPSMYVYSCPYISFISFNQYSNF